MKRSTSRSPSRSRSSMGGAKSRSLAAAAEAAATAPPAEVDPVVNAVPAGGSIPAHMRGQDTSLHFLYQPHTLTILILGLLVIVYTAFTLPDEQRESNLKRGIAAASAVFIVFSMLQMRDGFLTRPHEAFWRAMMGVSLLYLFGMIFLLFQSPDDTRAVFHSIDKTLGPKLEDREYATDCRLLTPEATAPLPWPLPYFANLASAVLDEFFVSHFVGWAVKALILRDVWILWVQSILWEFVEMSLEHVLPNFKECWWDHIILDVLLCNGVGIAVGMVAVKWLQMKGYDWPGSGQPTGARKLVRGMLRVGPERVDVYQWKVLLNWKRFLALLGLTIVYEVIELNAFLLKRALWIPPKNFINVLRLILWAFIGAPATREYYQYLVDPSMKKFGAMTWIALATGMAEFLVSIKILWPEFSQQPLPGSVLWSWVAFLVVSISWFIWYFFVRTDEPKKDE